MDLAKKIRQFRCVTNSSEEVARNFLEACNGDVDMAICMHLESGGATSAGGQVPTQAQNSLSPKAYEQM